MRATRGLERHHEQDPHKLLRDTRTLGQRFIDFFSNATSVVVLFAGMAVCNIVLAELADLILLTGAGCFWYAYTRKTTLPFRIPKRSGLMDYNDLIPGGKKPRKAQGICLFGNEISTGEE